MARAWQRVLSVAGAGPSGLVAVGGADGLLKREPGVVGGPAQPHQVPVDLAVERQVSWRQRAARRPAGRQVPAQLVGVGAFGEPPVLPRVQDPVPIGLVHPRRVRARLEQLDALAPKPSASRMTGRVVLDTGSVGVLLTEPPIKAGGAQGWRPRD